MRAIVVVLLGLALIASQVAHGGAFIPSLMVLSLALVGLALLVSVPLQARQSAPPLPQIIAAGVFGGFVLWRCALADDSELARVDAGHWLLYLGAWLAVSSSISGRRPAVWLTLTIIGAVTIEGAFAGFQATRTDDSSIPFWFSEQLRVTYFGRFGNRVRGLFLNPNQLAWAANVAALLALGMGIWGRMGLIWRIVLVYFAAVFAVICLLTASRGGMVALVVGFVGFGVLSLAILVRSRARRRGPLVAGVAISLGIMIALIGVVYANNWVARGRLDTFLESSIREQYAEYGLRMFQQNPVLGGGPGTFVYEAREFRFNRDNPNDAVFAHDDWLQFVAEYGFVGLFTWLLFAGIVGFGAIRELLRITGGASSDRDSPMSRRGGILIGAIAAWLACLAHGVTDFNLHIPANGLLAAFTMGMMVPSSRETCCGLGLMVCRGLMIGLSVTVMGFIGLYLWTFSYADYWALKAENALFRGDMDQALASVDRGLSYRAENPKLNELLSKAQFGYLGAQQFAADQRDGVLVIDDSDTKTAIESSVSEMSAVERNRVALAAIEKAIKVQPRERRYWIQASQILIELSEQDEAAEYIREAIRLDPMHAYTWENLGDMLYDDDRLEDALKIYEIGSLLDGGENCFYAAEELREELAAEEGVQQ